ncbi:uncharacterized protein LOC123312934 [Coccinella septempunctata]|uniref:uncharacterized protein LOC123312934 n=1 Tax=Coccinella septempunctata TaxID=41139 RepID=UPI001D08764A|nr:uncharacterized protein LOC123312934 [Coccinella septempunctata]
MTNTPFVIFLFVVATVTAKIYKKCELAKELKYKYEFDLKEIPVWVCIAKHESNFNTTAVNRGSGDHGLFQISDLYWCDTQRQGRACYAQCKFFEDDDISDDIECVKTIYEEHERISGNGFDAWVVYSHFCKDKNSTYLEECFHPVGTNVSKNNFHNASEGLDGKRREEEIISTIPKVMASVTNTVTQSTPVSSHKIEPNDDKAPSKIIFTSLGYFISKTSPSIDLQNLKISIPTQSIKTSTSFPRNYKSSTTSHSSTTVSYRPAEHKSHKHFRVGLEKNTVKLQSSGHIFQGISFSRDALGQHKTGRNTTWSFRENKTPRVSFLQNRLAKKRSQDEIIQEIKLGEMYSFQRTRGGGFQLRLI